MYEVYRNIEYHIPQLREYARAISHNAVAADDLVQRSILRAFATSHSYKPGTNLGAWLFTILHNQHVSDLRHNTREGVATEIDRVSLSRAMARSQDRSVILKMAERALRVLPDGQRILIELVARAWESEHDRAQSSRLAPGAIKCCAFPAGKERCTTSAGHESHRAAVASRMSTNQSPMRL